MAVRRPNAAYSKPATSKRPAKPGHKVSTKPARAEGASRPARPGVKISARSAEPEFEPSSRPSTAARRPAPQGTAKPSRPARSGPSSARPARPASQEGAQGAARPARPVNRPQRPQVTKPGRVQTSTPLPGSAKHSHLERLQKILAHAGIASRRACEELILGGHVHVNGEVVTELGAKADPLRDEITVNHKPIQREAPVYVLVNKPMGYITTVKDDQGRPTVMALVQGIDARLYPVGRLDFNSEGLLLLTNDGAVAERLTSPDHELPKVYLVKVHRALTKEQIAELSGGFRLDGRRLKPCTIEVMDKQQNPWLKVTLTEGKNRQIRRMFEAIGHPVHKLRRIQFGPIADPLLKPGAWRFLHP
ncbi:MAG TPA: pseudouridine synthase, partial [Holophagaceae bacterium]|nr:pseudouridine synthase [Holophagaceae bacterium]